MRSATRDVLAVLSHNAAGRAGDVTLIRVPSSVMAIVGSSGWEQTQSFRDSRIRFEWHPLLETSSKTGTWLGVTRDGEWAVGRPGRGTGSSVAGTAVITGDERVAVPLLAWLERPATGVRDEWCDFARARGLNGEAFWGSVPWLVAIRAGLRSGRDHWVDAALNWAEDLDVIELIQGDVEGVDTRALTQQTRHRLKMVGRWERGAG